MVITIVDIFFMVVELAVFTGCAVMVVNLLPKKADKPQWVKVVYWGIYTILSVVVPNLGRNDILTIIVLTAFYLIVGWRLYHRSKMGLLYQMIYMAVMYFVQLISIFATIILADVFQLENTTRYYLLSLLKALFSVVIIIIFSAILKKRYVSDQKNMKIRGMVLVPLISIVITFLYIMGSEIFFFRYGYKWLIIYSILVLIINLYCLYFWYDVAANQTLRHKLGLMQQQNELIHQYYEEMEKNYNKSRKIIHDIRNHINVLEESVKLEQVQDYFNDVHEMLNSLGLKFYSENRMLNIVLNDKLKNLPSEQIECNMGGVSLHFLSDIDITTIFANLLDNALEAAPETEDFWLKLWGEQIQDFTVVKICNLYKGEYKPGYSVKNGHEGLGLENVRQSLNKYNGELEIEYQNNVFSITIVFPGQ